MLRRILPSALVGLLASGSAQAATFDAPSGSLRLDTDPTVVNAVSFDSPQSLGALPARIFSVTRDRGYARLADSDEVLDAARFVSGGASLEGKGAVRVAGDRALVLGDAASLASVAASRVEIRFFARAEGAGPELRAVYAREAVDAARASYPYAQVVAYRTGRATSDGWVELSTGPIDGSIRGAALSALVLVADGAAPSGASFLVDALEIRRVPGELLSGGDCTVASEASVCKKGAVCIEGACTDAAAVYGALPPLETRRAIVARTATYLTTFQADRHGLAEAAAGFAKELPAVADSAQTPEAFFRPFAAAVGRARAAHTSAPFPMSVSGLAAAMNQSVRYRGTELNACFGVVERDLSGGGRGYAVYRAESPSALAVGDVLDTVDGEPVDTWVGRVAAENGLLAADPDSDRPTSAFMLSATLMRYGRTMSLRRCTADAVCESVPVDLDELRKHRADVVPMTCSPRFKLAVTPDGADPDDYQTAIAQTEGGITTVHTNGEPPEDNQQWVQTVKAAFDGAPERMLIDKRRGDGGGGSALATWARYARRPSGFGLLTVFRVDSTAVDGPPTFLDELFTRCNGRSSAGRCALSSWETYPAAPGTAPAKAAWLNVLDGSASDYATYFAKGASGFRVFAPNRTMGLFGGLGVMAPFLPGWNGGTVQIQDSREGQTPPEWKAGAWRSGRGIEPDEIVVQRQSDLVAGRDTMLERARAWLLEP